MKNLIFTNIFILSLMTIEVGTVCSQLVEDQSVPSEKVLAETINKKSSTYQNQEDPRSNLTGPKKLIIDLDNLKTSDDLVEKKEEKSYNNMDTLPKKTEGMNIYKKGKPKPKTKPKSIKIPKIANPKDDLLDKAEIEGGIEVGF